MGGRRGPGAGSQVDDTVRRRELGDGRSADGAANDRRTAGGGRWSLPHPPARAVVGGAMVVVAVAGVLLAHGSATSPPEERVVVAVRTLVPGHEIEAEDLGTVAAELPAEVAVVPSTDAPDLVGRVVQRRIGELGLVEPGDVAPAGRRRAGSVELTVDLPPAAAMAGVVREGDVVQVLSTDPDGEGTAVVADAVVVDPGGSTDGAIGSSAESRVRLAAASEETALRIVDATLRSQVTLTLPAPAVEDPQ